MTIAEKGKPQLKPEEKAEILLEFVEEKKKVPKRGEVYLDVKIGQFWDRIKQGQCKEIYENILSKNDILREDHERCQKLQKLKEEKKGKHQLTTEEKAEILLEFVEKKKRMPKRDELYEGVNIGIFWDGIKQRRKEEETQKGDD